MTHTFNAQSSFDHRKPGVFGAVRRRGAEEAGAVFVKVATLDGHAMLYVPAPQTVYDESRPIERFFVPIAAAPLPETAVDKETLSILAEMGHSVIPVSGYGQSVFGRGQIILRDVKTGVLCSGSDPRADGCAMSL